MNEHQAFQERKPNTSEVIHKGLKGQTLSRYELRFINEDWKDKRDETYRGDKTLEIFKGFGAAVETELDALIMKLNRQKHWVQAFIYDNSGIEFRKVVLHIKNGIIETDLIQYPSWQMPAEKKQ